MNLEDVNKRITELEDKYGRTTNEEDVELGHLCFALANHHSLKFQKLIDTLRWLADEMMPDDPESFDSYVLAISIIEEVEEVEM